MPVRRSLKFNNYSEIIKEVESLRKNGYQSSGKWNLGQICRHLGYYFKGSLDGYPKMLPWIIRATIGKMVLKKLLSKSETKPGGQTDPKSIYAPEPDEKPAIDEFIELTKRLESNTAPLHPSAFFGEVTNEEWEILHLGHAAHHLSFLHPKN